MAYTFYHKPWDSDTWSDITSNVQQSTLNFSDTLDNDPFTFGFNIYDRIKNSDTQLDIQDGDLIAITIDDERREIAQNGKLVGIIDLDQNINSADYVNTTTKPFRYSNDVTCKEYDFSDCKLHNYPELSSSTLQGYVDTSFETILNAILQDSDELLGGIINEVTIPKFSLLLDDFTVKSFKEKNVSTRQGVVKLLGDEKLYFKLRWFVEPDATYTIKLAAQLQINDRAGITPYHPAWALQGMDDDIIRKGKIDNSATSDVNSLEPTAYYCGKEVDLNTDKDIIRNQIIMDANIVFNSDAFDDLDTALERYIFTATGVKKFDYTLPYPALDIKYVGFLVESIVTSDFVATTSKFSIPDKDVLSFEVGDLIRVYNKSTQVSNFRLVFAVDTGANTLTTSEVLDFTPETGDIVENVMQNWITIYEDNQVNYASIGVVKELETDKPAKLRFLDLSEPPPGIKIVVYYYRVQKYKDQPFDSASCKRYGIKTEKVKLKGIFTIEQIRQITRELLITEPNKSVSFITYRPSEAGMIVPVDITNFFTGNLLATEVSAEYKGRENNFNYWEYSVTLSEKRDNIEDILRRINNNFDPERPSGPENNRLVLRETVNVITGFTTNKIQAFLVFESDRSGTDNIWRCKVDGTEFVQITSYTSGGIQGISIHPSGTKIAYGYDNDIYEININSGSITQITNTGTTNTVPVYSPNGLQLAFFTDRDSNNRWAIFNNGESDLKGDSPTILTNVNTPALLTYCGWNPDSDKLLYSGFDGADYNIYSINTDNTGNGLIYSNPGVSLSRISWNPDNTDAIFDNETTPGNSATREIGRITPVQSGGTTSFLTSTAGTVYSSQASYSRSDGGNYIYYKQLDTAVGTFNEIWRMDAKTGANNTQIIPDDAYTYNSVVEGKLLI